MAAPDHRPPPPRADGGFLTVQYVVAVAFSLVLLTTLANLVVFQYGRGAVRAALDEGVRSGSRATASVADCQARADRALADLLGGTLGRDVSIVCSETPGRMRATATVTFRGWLPTVPDWSFEIGAAAVKEALP